MTRNRPAPSSQSEPNAKQARPAIPPDTSERGGFLKIDWSVLGGGLLGGVLFVLFLIWSHAEQAQTAIASATFQSPVQISTAEKTAPASDPPRGTSHNGDSAPLDPASWKPLTTLSSDELLAEKARLEDELAILRLREEVRVLREQYVELSQQ